MGPDPTLQLFDSVVRDGDHLHKAPSLLQRDWPMHEVYAQLF